MADEAAKGLGIVRQEKILIGKGETAWTREDGDSREGTLHERPKGITYAEVVTLEVPDYSQHPEITYSRSTERHGNKPEGIFTQAQ
jgi:hypothetical protein